MDYLSLEEVCDRVGLTKKSIRLFKLSINRSNLSIWLPGKQMADIALNKKM